MKTIRIILLILIILGIIALLTQSIWVPKLVDKILSYENIPVILPEIEQEILPIKDGRQCYVYNHEATTDAPYTVNEFLDLTISNNTVTGTKTGTQYGPDMTNGYQGSITGSLNKNIIDVIFSYTIEGSKNKEKEIYRANKTGLEKLRYPLMEKDGILIPDENKEYQTLLYPRVICTASN